MYSDTIGGVIGHIERVLDHAAQTREIPKPVRDRCAILVDLTRGTRLNTDLVVLSQGTFVEIQCRYQDNHEMALCRLIPDGESVLLPLSTPILR